MWKPNSLGLAPFAVVCRADKVEVGVVMDWVDQVVGVVLDRVDQVVCVVLDRVGEARVG